MGRMAYPGTDYEPLYKWSYYAAIAIVFAGIMFFQPLAKSPPPNSAAYGCYTATSAPAILLNRDGMSILQKGFPRIPFHLENHKTAIALTADVPIQADLVDNSYEYAMYHPGEGWYLNFQKIEAGRRYGQVDAAKLSMFAMLARDGTEILYSKGPLDRCERD